MFKKKSVMLTVLILVIALLGVWFANKYGGGNQLEATVSPSPSPTPTAVKKIQAPKSGTAEQTVPYSVLVEQYEGRRIQFDINCQAIPSITTFKAGASVMFDNRSGDAREVKIGNVQYSFPGFGYKTLTLSSQTLPDTLYLSCGSAVNVGKILLQN